MNNNRVVLQSMRKIYYGKDLPYIDWMGFNITNENKPSYHHIEKSELLKCNSKSYDATIENGAYLGKKSHELLHQIENIDKELYDSWNYIFLVINKMNCYPIDDIWKTVYSLQEKTLEIIENKGIHNKK